MNYFLLSRKECDGECCEITYYSLHSSLEAAQDKQKELLKPSHFYAKEAPNEWQKSKYEDNVWEFPTGSRGWVIWEVRELELEE